MGGAQPAGVLDRQPPGRGPRAGGRRRCRRRLERAAVEAQISGVAADVPVRHVRRWRDRPRDTRTVLACNAHVRHRQWPDRGDVEFGVFRMWDQRSMITRVLVANRGEIARRVFATRRRLVSDRCRLHPDPDAASPHVVGPTPACASTAIWTPRTRRGGVAAVADRSTGYGFLSENAVFDGGRPTPVSPSGFGRRGGHRDGLEDRGQEDDAAAGVPVWELDPSSRAAPTSCRCW